MEDLMIYLSILTEEYRSLRDESKQASINMFTALRWGAAVLGIVITAGFTQWNKQHAVVLLTFFILVPILGAVAMFLWLGEAARFKRVGDYICLIEQKAGMVLDEVKQKYGIKERWEKFKEPLENSISISHSALDMSDPLAWEQWLRDMKGKSVTEGHQIWIYKIRLSFFILLMAFSFLIGTYYVLTHPRFTPYVLIWLERCIPEVKIKVVILILVSIVIILTTGIIAFRIGRKLDVKTKSFTREQIEKRNDF